MIEIKYGHQIRREIVYYFKFTGGNKWYPVPEMREKITLAEPRMANISYNFALSDGVSMHVLIRLLINGKERT